MQLLLIFARRAARDEDWHKVLHSSHNVLCALHQPQQQPEALLSRHLHPANPPSASLDCLGSNPRAHRAAEVTCTSTSLPRHSGWMASTCSKACGQVDKFGSRGARLNQHGIVNAHYAAALRWLLYAVGAHSNCLSCNPR